jgi:hypothetical protein
LGGRFPHPRPDRGTRPFSTLLVKEAHCRETPLCPIVYMQKITPNLKNTPKILKIEKSRKIAS